MPPIDLIQEANLGVTKAIARFDRTKDVKFSTYAMNWIKQSIQLAIAENSRLIRLPRDVHTQWAETRRVAAEFEQNGHMPTDKEIATGAGIDLARLALLHKVGDVHLTSLNQRVGEDTSEELIEVLDFSDRGLQEEALVTRLTIEHLYNGGELDAREKIILALRSGTFDLLPASLELKDKNGCKVAFKPALDALPTTDRLTQKAAAKILGITREQFQIYEKSATKKAQMVLSQ
jgi:RNA polymerase primary sigma factor